MPSPRSELLRGREVRSFATTLEARDDGGLQFILSGYASVVEVPYDMGAYTETIRAGAFRKTLSERPDVQLLVNHQNMPIGRTTIPWGQPGSLQLTEDSQGLHVLAQLDRNDPDAQTVMRKVGTGLMDQMSFGFTVTRQSWSDDRSKRFIEEVNLNRGDVSVVNLGASPTTSVVARAAGRQRPNRAYYEAVATALKLKSGR